MFTLNAILADYKGHKGFLKFRRGSLTKVLEQSNGHALGTVPRQEPFNEHWSEQAARRFGSVIRIAQSDLIGQFRGGVV